MKIKIYIKPFRLDSSKSSFHNLPRTYQLYGYREEKSHFEKVSEFISEKNYIKLRFTDDCRFLFFYLVVDHQFLSIFTLDDCKVVIDERSTVANVFCFSKFIKQFQDEYQKKKNQKEKKKNQKDSKEKDSKEKDSKENQKEKNQKEKEKDSEENSEEDSKDIFSIALGMRNNFIHIDGILSEVIQSNPNNLETNSYPMFNFLSTILNYAIFDILFRLEFLALVQESNILDGLISIVQNPTNHVIEIYLLGSSRPPIFIPALNTISLPEWKSPVPDQWTLTIKFNRNGSENFIIGGPGALVFDKNNRAWINNNVRQGTPNSSTFCTVLESNGEPASFSPLFGGGLLGAGFGIAINQRRGRSQSLLNKKEDCGCKGWKSERIAIGNFGWGSTDYNPQNGSVSVFKNDGSILSPSNGAPLNSKFKRAQGIYYDKHDRLWISVWGSQNPLGGGGDSTFNFENGNSGVAVLDSDNRMIDFFQFNSPFFGTFDLIVDEEDNVFVSNAGNLTENIPSSLYHFKLIDRKIVQVNFWETETPEGFRQISFNRSGDLYLAAVISSKVYKLDKQLNILKTFTQSLDGPWGIAFDRDDTIYVSNFRRDTFNINDHTFDMEGKFGVTVIKNDDESTAKLFTLPTGGNPVTLANGFPLYGSDSLPSYEPLMRLTNSRVDKGGNLWSLNNWKPSLINNFLNNPGGDGIVVFIGIAS